MSNPPKVVITADAACGLSSELIKKWNILVISASVKTKSGTFLEDEEISAENAVEYTKATHSEPELLSPSVGEYVSFFEKALSDAVSVCHFSVSSKVGKAFYNAVEAALSLQNVHVVDSLQLSTGIGFQVLQAARLAADGFDVPFIKKATAELQSKICVSFAAPDYEYGHITGRISPVGSSCTEMFYLSPIVRIKNGAVKSRLFRTKRCDFWKKYIKKEFGGRKKTDTELLFVCCCNPNTFPIEKIKAEIEKYVVFDKIIPVKMSAKIAFKLGPNAFGLHYLVH